MVNCPLSDTYNIVFISVGNGKWNIYDEWTPLILTHLVPWDIGYFIVLVNYMIEAKFFIKTDFIGVLVQT